MRAALPAEEFAAAWSAGQAMTPEQAIIGLLGAGDARARPPRAAPAVLR